MLTRDQITILILAIFFSQLLVNVATLALVIYKVMRMNQFFQWSRDYLQLTKQYIDLINVERGRLTKALHENTTTTARVLEETAREIKQEIRQSAADTKTEQEQKDGA